MFDVPDRCLLSQAFLWFNENVTPLPDKVFKQAPVFVDEPGDQRRAFFLMMVANKIALKGDLTFEAHNYYLNSADQPELKDWSPPVRYLCDHQIDPERILLKDVSFSLSEIEVSQPEFTWLINNETLKKIQLRCPRNEGWQWKTSFADVTIDFAALQSRVERIASHQVPSFASDSLPPFLSPYIHFMIRASRELEIHPDNMPIKDNVKEWLIANWPSEFGALDPNRRNDEIEKMATFLRRPEDKKGGNKKMKDI